MESFKYTGNMAGMFGSNTPESPTSCVVVVKTKRIQRDKRAIPFFCVPSPSLRRVDALFCLHTLNFFLFFHILGATCDASLTLMNHLTKDE